MTETNYRLVASQLRQALGDETDALANAANFVAVLLLMLVATAVTLAIPIHAGRFVDQLTEAGSLTADTTALTVLALLLIPLAAHAGADPKPSARAAYIRSHYTKFEHRVRMRDGARLFQHQQRRGHALQQSRHGIYHLRLDRPGQALADGVRARL